MKKIRESLENQCEVVKGMQKIAKLTGTALFLLLSAGSALAAERPAELTTQQLAQSSIPAGRSVRGIVKSVVGDVLIIQPKDGKTKTVTVPKRLRGYLGQILGSEVIVTSNTIYMAPPPAPVVQRPRPIQFPQSSPPAPTPPTRVPTVTPPPPTPVPTPIPSVPRQIIPQTW
ncbi:MAG: hypothetical protein N3E45_16215 [Oscillatoriaceae bacterium SKW80]|nr:hypothetical protein [Oscillatoriaceae bacterium SKYG93]MCX8122343.1 hypothetical protein [Oscillatoriaceae bacterium SKW80]MDW8452451.1 hypothetical protein [Oscillatoriaceae cyanobacterium SKYGB_i_bin93]HIK27730.1 hypothetical protein [Oscillatoriaceae cyanobacterium M7585_C2015_266]